MSVFQHWKTTYGFLYNGVSYDFLDVDNYARAKTEAKHLTRGSNSKNKKGIAYKENSKAADTATLTVLNISKAIRDLLTQIYENEDRVNFYVIDEKMGHKITYFDALLSQIPFEAQIGDGDTYNMDLVFESFNVVTKMVSDED